MVNIEFLNANREHFGNSTGLMGGYYDGLMWGRDGVTTFDDFNKFGLEWQVRDTEASLFETVRAPQYPAQCKFPDATKNALAVSGGLTKQAAEKACDHMGANKQRCIADVMATGDLDVATSGVY
jgi:hypothetical protein